MSEDRTEQCGKMPKTAAPQHDVNFDEIGHWPQCVQKKAGTEYARWQAVLSVWNVPDRTAMKIDQFTFVWKVIVIGFTTTIL